MNVFDAETVTKYFRSLYVTKIKDTISSYLLHRKISILEMNAYIDEISQYMKETICPIMEEYGLELTSFYVNEISLANVNKMHLQIFAYAFDGLFFIAGRR